VNKNAIAGLQLSLYWEPHHSRIGKMEYKRQERRVLGIARTASTRTMTNTKMFALPQTSGDFFEQVHRKCQTLIELGIWDIDRARFSGWLNQFVTDEERFFAACVLDCLMYRSRDQFTASLRSLVRGQLRQALPKLQPAHDGAVELLLADGIGSKVCLCPAIDREAPPTKSGPFILRRLKKALNASTDIMHWPWKANAEIKAGKVNTVILVDDFLGTGTQVNDFLAAEFGPLDPNVHWIYAPVVAHDTGIAYLATKQPHLRVVCAERLGPDHGFFNDDYWKLVSNGTILGQDAKAFYEEFLHRRKLTASGDFGFAPFGFGGLSLCFGFEHGTPDNSLPLLWGRADGWQPLLDR